MESALSVLVFCTLHTVLRTRKSILLLQSKLLPSADELDIETLSRYGQLAHTGWYQLAHIRRFP